MEEIWKEENFEERKGTKICLVWLVVLCVLVEVAGCVGEEVYLEVYLLGMWQERDLDEKLNKREAMHFLIRHSYSFCVSYPQHVYVYFYPLWRFVHDEVVFQEREQWLHVQQIYKSEQNERREKRR